LAIIGPRANGPMEEITKKINPALANLIDTWFLLSAFVSLKKRQQNQ
jgi:hypothetical protein